MMLRSPAKQHTLYNWNLISGSLRSVDLDAIPMFTHWDEDTSVITVIELDLTESLFRFSRKRYSTADDNPLAGAPGQSFNNNTPRRQPNNNLVLIESKILVTTQPKYSPSYNPFPTAVRYNQYLCRYGTAITQYLTGPYLDARIFIRYRASTGHLTVFTIDEFKRMNHRTHGIDSSQSKLLSPEGLLYSPGLTNEINLHSVFTNTKSPANFPVNYQDCFQGTGWLTFGNPQLYGVIGSRGIAVWSFDPDLKFSN